MQFIVVYTIECSAAHPQALRVMMAMEGMATLLMMKKRIMFIICYEQDVEQQGEFPVAASGADSDD